MLAGDGQCYCPDKVSFVLTWAEKPRREEEAKLKTE